MQKSSDNLEFTPISAVKMENILQRVLVGMSQQSHDQV